MSQVNKEITPINNEKTPSIQEKERYNDKISLSPIKAGYVQHTTPTFDP